MLCFYCDEPAGVSEFTEEDLGGLEPHSSGEQTALFHAKCWENMLSNPGCTED